ncbi:MAG: M48 family metalloprotease [PVC group bacterium]|nr:M48 family metalloprotease [PVC group bacterium]
MYDEDDSRTYCRIRDKFFFINCGVTALFFVIMTFSFSVPLYQFVMAMTENSVIVITIYTFIFYIAYFIFTFGLKYYVEFFLKQKLGMLEQELSVWIKDVVKKEATIFCIFLVCVQIIYFLLETHGHWWWLWAASIYIVFSVGKDILPGAILPLFMKYSQLRDDFLKQRLISLSGTANIRIDNVYTVLSSGGVGLGSKIFVDPIINRRIILTDTVQDYSPEEIGVLLAHDLAHHYYGHYWKMLLLKVVMALLGAFIIGVSFDYLARGIGFVPISSIASFPLMAILIYAVLLIFMPIYNSFSREMEQDADNFALQITKSPDAFGSVIVRDSQQRLIDSNPRRFIEIMLYKEPSPNRRISMAEDYAQELSFQNRKRTF